MTNITFSKRLSGTTACVIYLALIAGFAPPVIRHHQLDGTETGTLLMLFAVALYALATIFGWRWCMQRQSVRLIRAYFVVMFLLAMAMFILENIDTRTGSGVGNLLVVLLLQSGILPLREHFSLHTVIIAAMTGISAWIMPLENVLPVSLVAFITNGAVVMIGHLIVQDEKTQLALEAANRKLSEYALQAEELATMRERNRLAREIHDTLGHYLTIVNTQIEAARTVMATDPERGVYLLERAQALTKEGLSEIRRSVSALRAAPIEQRPLPDAIQALIDDHASSGLVIGYQVNGQVRRCSATIEQALYRVVQEGLTNIRRHAHATQADIQLWYADGQVVVAICDNGIGNDNPKPGFGLMGLQERIKLLNGVLRTEVARNGGFTLRVEVPG